MVHGVNGWVGGEGRNDSDSTSWKAGKGDTRHSRCRQFMVCLSAAHKNGENHEQVKQSGRNASSTALEMLSIIKIKEMLFSLHLTVEELTATAGQKALDK